MSINTLANRLPFVPGMRLMPAVLVIAACFCAPAALAQAAPAPAAPFAPFAPFEIAAVSTAAPAAPASPVFPEIPGVVVKQFAFGVFHDTETAAIRLDPTLEVSRNGTPVGWVIKLDTSQPTVRWREEFTTPVPPQTWGLTADKADTKLPNLSADKRTATIERRVPVKSDIFHHWTLDASDPAGPYTMRVWVEDVLVATVNFLVK